MNFKKILHLITNDRIPDPPYSYDEIMNIPQSLYAEYLEKMYKFETNKKLNLKNPKSINEKIQWLKLYDNIPIKTQLTDKVKVRDWVKDKIGDEYLKPLLWHGYSFDDIPWDILPDSFFLKANHGWRWQVMIRNKKKLLDNKSLFEIVKQRCNIWLSLSFFGYSKIEIQYKDIIPQLLVEPIIKEESKERPLDIEVYCFNGKPKITRKMIYLIKSFEPKTNHRQNVYDENFNNITYFSNPDIKSEYEDADGIVRKAFSLSSKLCQDFKLVRVDWLYGNNKLFFNEMTFTPKSGFFNFADEKYEEYISKMLILK